MENMRTATTPGIPIIPCEARGFEHPICLRYSINEFKTACRTDTRGTEFERDEPEIGNTQNDRSRERKT